MEIGRELTKHPELRVRMGIHSGPVNEISDLNEQANIAGAGINIAQRVMDCGDAGHILLSKRVADDLEQYPQWRSQLHELGDCEVKHGLRLGVVNLYQDGIGNPQLPKKFEVLKKHRAQARWAAIATALLLLAGVVGAFVIVSKKSGKSTSTVPEKSIAVLPFENLSDDKANAYFADGVQDEILTDLAKVADLKVISRTSVMQYRNTTSRNLREIGQQLGVAHVLEGSVRRAANKIRVNAQLVDARNDAHLWAQTYDRDLADVFAIQSEIARTIAEQLQAQLTPGELAEIARAPTHDVVAHDLFVRALALNDMVNDPAGKESLLQAVDLLEGAVSRDPKFLLAYCLLCDINLNLYWFGFDHTAARRERARQALQKAQLISPDAGAVHLQAGFYAYHGFRDYETARRELELALRTLPNSAAAYFNSAAIDRRQGRWDNSLSNFNRAVELDPRNFNIVEEAGFTYDALRRYAQGRKLLRTAIELSPKDYEARVALARSSWLERGDLAPLRAQLNEFVREGTEATRNAAQFFVHCALAERDRAAAIQALDYLPAEGTMDPGANFVMPREWYVGLVSRTFGDSEGAAKAFTAARAIAAKTVAEQPDYAEAWGLLGAIECRPWPQGRCHIRR
jgi:TolB-like protein/Tfp pilus assembly protein PilF